MQSTKVQFLQLYVIIYIHIRALSENVLFHHFHGNFHKEHDEEAVDFEVGRLGTRAMGSPATLAGKHGKSTSRGSICFVYYVLPSGKLT